MSLYEAVFEIKPNREVPRNPAKNQKDRLEAKQQGHENLKYSKDDVLPEQTQKGQKTKKISTNTTKKWSSKVKKKNEIKRGKSSSKLEIWCRLKQIEPAKTSLLHLLGKILELDNDYTSVVTTVERYEL